MAFRLPRLPDTQPPWSTFKLWWQRVMEAIEKEVKTQDDTINNIRRLLSHTNPTTILQAVDNGTTCTLKIIDHVRVYADGTAVNIVGNGSGVVGNSSDTWYACYYDDATLSLTTPTFVFTTTPETAQAAKAPGRHFCGMIRTPVAATGVTISSGGAYPTGTASIGGEIQ